jgi:hypothetical protein
LVVGWIALRIPTTSSTRRSSCTNSFADRSLDHRLDGAPVSGRRERTARLVSLRLEPSDPVRRGRHPVVVEEREPRRHQATRLVSQRDEALDVREVLVLESVARAGDLMLEITVPVWADALLRPVTLEELEAGEAGVLRLSTNEWAGLVGDEEPFYNV